MKGHGERSRRAWEALLNRAERVPKSTESEDVTEEMILRPRSPQEEVVVKGIADGFERYLIEKDRGGKKGNNKTIKIGNGSRGETWGQYLVKSIKELGAKDIVFNEETDKKIRFSFPDRKGRFQKRLLYLNEVADFIRKQQTKNGKVLVKKSHSVRETNQDAHEVDTTKVITPFSIRGDLRKSDQEALDINEYIKNEDELKKRQQAIADLFAQKGALVQQEKGDVVHEPVLASEGGEPSHEKIVLPKDKERVRVLTEKLSEYQTRYEEYSKSAQDYTEGDFGFIKSQQRILDTLCKLSILNELILVGEISRTDALDDLEGRYGADNRLIYENAYNVIEDYVLNGGLNVSGGTGLETKSDKNELKPEIPDAEDATDEVAFRFNKKPDISDAEIISERKRGEQKFFDTRFETEFGITEEQISQIEGYERLSEGQQKLVLGNLREYARDTRGGYLSRVWEGILKSTGREAKDKNYIEAVTVLIRNTAQFGPKIHEENGELLTDFIDVGIPQQFRKEHKPIFDRFNALAHRYAKMKVEDLEDGIGTHSKDESKLVSFFKNVFSESRMKHDTYEALQESYEGAKRALAQSLGDMGKSEGEIAEKLVQIDNKVHSLRFLQTEPEAVEVIKQNPDKSFWQKAGEKVFSKENMTYAGLGFVGRMALTGAMGLYAAPVVASAVGGIRSWNKTSAELREKDRMARAGTRDVSGEALNIVDVTREIKVGQDGKKDVGLTQKLLDLIHEYQNEDAKDGGIGEGRTKTLERIRARVAYVDDKLNLNRINFGSGTERSANMASLFEALGEARVLLADTEMSKGSALEARLEQYLTKREGLIQTRRRKKQIKTAVWGTLKAGALAFAGRELAEYIKEIDFFNKEGSTAGGVAGGTASVSQSAEAPSPKQYGYQAEVRDVDNEIIQKTEVPRTEEVGIRVGDTSPETTPQASGPSPQSPDAQIPNNEIPDTRPVEEVQKVDVENGRESRLYSSDMTAVGESARVGNAPDEIIEIKGYPPIKTIEANEHVLSKVPEEGVRIPKGLEGGATVSEAQAEGSSSRPYLGEDSLPDKEPSVSDAGSSSSDSVESDTRRPESTAPDFTDDSDTVRDIENNAPGVKSTPDVLGQQETFSNTNGVEIDPKKEHIYELTGRGGEKVMVSYGGKNFETRFDTAQEYVQKNPDAVVVVEEEPRYGAFGQKLPPSYVEVRNIRGEGVTTIFSIQDDTLPASSEKGIDPATFTKKVTK